MATFETFEGAPQVKPEGSPFQDELNGRPTQKGKSRSTETAEPAQPSSRADSHPARRTAADAGWHPRFTAPTRGDLFRLNDKYWKSYLEEQRVKEGNSEKNPIASSAKAQNRQVENGETLEQFVDRKMAQDAERLGKLSDSDRKVLGEVSSALGRENVSEAQKVLRNAYDQENYNKGKVERVQVGLQRELERMGLENAWAINISPGFGGANLQIVDKRSKGIIYNSQIGRTLTTKAHSTVDGSAQPTKSDSKATKAAAGESESELRSLSRRFPGVTFGDNVTVEEGAHIKPGAKVLDGAHIGKNVQVGGGATIGKEVHIGKASEIGPGAIVSDETTIGEGVLVDAGVKIGKEVEVGDGAAIWHGAVVGDFSRIGEEAFVGSESKIGKGVQVGKRAIIRSNAKIDVLAKIGDGATVGQEVIIEGFAKIGNSAAIGDGATIGDNVDIKRNARIGTSATIGDGATVGERANIEGLAEIANGVIIGDGATVGQRAVIGKGVLVGYEAKVGRGAVVERDVYAYTEIDDRAKIHNNTVAARPSTTSLHDLPVPSGSTIESGRQGTERNVHTTRGAVPGRNAQLADPSHQGIEEAAAAALKASTPVAADVVMSAAPGVNEASGRSVEASRISQAIANTPPEKLVRILENDPDGRKLAEHYQIDTSRLEPGARKALAEEAKGRLKGAGVPLALGYVEEAIARAFGL